MKFLLECKCGAHTWQSGSFESDVNAVSLNDDDRPEWEGGNPKCEHDEFEIIDEDPDD